MNVKKFLPLIAAAGLGLVALIIAHSGLGRGEAKAKAEPTVHVIVAKESVGPGQTLTADNLAEQILPASNLPQNQNAYTRMDQVVGRVTVAPMVAGQPVLNTFLAAPGSLPGLPALVPPGMRAVTIDVNETTGVAGLIVPGSHVDIVSVINTGEHDKACARTVCANVPVVAVGQRMSANRAEGDTGVAHTVTLIAKPREAELIKLAYMSANTSLVLRGNGDVGPPDSRGVVFTDLLGPPAISHNPAPIMAGGTGSAAPTPAATTQQAPQIASNQQPQSHVRHVTIIQGGQVSMVTFEVPDDSAAVDPDNYTNTDPSFVIPNQK